MKGPAAKVLAHEAHFNVEEGMKAELQVGDRYRGPTTGITLSTEVQYATAAGISVFFRKSSFALVMYRYPGSEVKFVPPVLFTYIVVMRIGEKEEEV